MIGTEVKFIIDNFSGIIKISDFISHIKSNNFHYKDCRKKPNIVDTKITGIYIIYDNNKIPIYVGKSSVCIRQRLLNHLYTKPKTCDEYENLYTLYKRTKYEYFSFVKTEITFAPFLEYYFIKKYKPKYNREFNKNFKYEDDWSVFLKQNKSDELNKKELLEESLFKKVMESVII